MCLKMHNRQKPNRWTHNAEPKMLHYYFSWHLAVKRTYLMTLITRFAITNHLWLNWRFRLIRKCFTMGMAATQQQKSDMAKNQKGANKGAIE